MAEDKLPPARNILVMSGLTGVSTLILASFLTLGSCDPLGKTGGCGVPATISIFAFAIGLPPMAMSILFAYAWLGSTTKVVSNFGNVLRGMGYFNLSVGILFAFWQLSVWAGLLFLFFSIISFGAYIQYVIRVHRANPPTK